MGFCLFGQKKEKKEGSGGFLTLNLKINRVPPISDKTLYLKMYSTNNAMTCLQTFLFQYCVSSGWALQAVFTFGFTFHRSSKNIRRDSAN